MIQTRLFRRHYAITVAVIGFFVVLGYFITTAAMRFAINRQQGFASGPQEFFARLIDDINQEDRLAALRHVEGLGIHQGLFQFSIVDADGRDLVTGQPIDHSWNQIRKPSQPFQSITLDFSGTEHRFPQPLGPPFGDELVRFPGEPAQYLYMRMSSEQRQGVRPPISLFFITFGSLVFSVLIGVAFALMLLFRSMSERMRLADGVISELKHGNLKARFPIRKMDELGQAMSRFNLMADEIERLVEQMRNVEKSRVSLLQDLTHDLRTPVASMKNLIATTSKRNAPEDATVRSELLGLAEREVDYFERLVEDLLVLAQISEPRYHVDQVSVSILEVLQEEAESVSARWAEASSAKEIMVASSIDPAFAEISGDLHLLRRMFRNALENAYSFARSEVKVVIESSDSKMIRILVQDDGPGLSAFALEGFGERRVSRTIEKEKGNRLSVGLGSVIMKTVAGIHCGRIEARNRADASGRVLGADVIIQLPR